MQRHGVHPIHGAHDAHRVAQSVRQLHRGDAVIVDAQLVGRGAEPRLPEIPPDEGQQADQIAADALQQVFHALALAGEVGVGVFSHKAVHQRFQILIGQLREGSALPGERLFQHPVGEGAADVGGQLRLLPGAGLEDVLQEIAKRTIAVPFKFGGADPQLGAEQCL